MKIKTQLIMVILITIISFSTAHAAELKKGFSVHSSGQLILNKRCPMPPSGIASGCGIAAVKKAWGAAMLLGYQHKSLEKHQLLKFFVPNPENPGSPELVNVRVYFNE